MPQRVPKGGRARTKSVKPKPAAFHEPEVARDAASGRDQRPLVVRIEVKRGAKLYLRAQVPLTFSVLRRFKPTRRQIIRLGWVTILPFLLFHLSGNGADAGTVAGEADYSCGLMDRV